MAPFFGSFFFSILCIFFLFDYVLSAANLDVKLDPQGPLKVRLDYGLATQINADEDWRRRWVFTSYLEFKEPVSSISDKKLRMIAQNAHKEMEADLRQYQPDVFGSVVPRVMTIMAFDNKILLSSSQKGRSGFLNQWPQSPVSLALDRCAALYRERVLADPSNPANPDQFHINEAKCGEVNVFHQYYMTNDKPVSELRPKARVTTVIKLGNGYKIIPPCGTMKDGSGRDSKDEWGCNLLVPDQDVDYIGNNVQAEGYSLKKIAGGVVKKGQIQMCTRNSIIWDGE